MLSQKDVSTKLRGYLDEQNRLRTDQKLLEQQRSSLQKRIVSLTVMRCSSRLILPQTDVQSAISSSEASFTAGQSLPRDLSAIRADMEDKEARIEKIKNEIKAAKYEEAIQDATNKIRGLEESREALNMELKNLTLQADSRAKLDINRADLSKKKRDIQAIVDNNSSRFKLLVGSDIQIDSMENDVDKAVRYAHQYCHSRNLTLKH